MEEREILASVEDAIGLLMDTGMNDTIPGRQGRETYQNDIACAYWHLRDAARRLQGDEG